MVALFLPNGGDHAEAHLHTAAGVSPLWLRDSRDAVITVPQNLNPQTLVLLHRQNTRHPQTERSNTSVRLLVILLNMTVFSRWSDLGQLIKAPKKLV